MSPQSILIIKTSSIGDVVLTTPVAQAIKTAYPGCYLAWLAEDKVADVVIDNPYVDEVIIWERRQMRELRKQRRWGDFRRSIGRLQSQLSARTYDYCFDLQGYDRTLLAYAFVRARRRLTLPGRDRWHGYTKHIWQRSPRQHAVDYHLEVVRSAGLDLAPVAPPMRIEFGDEAKAKAREILRAIPSSGPLVAINPASTWASKQWELERYAELADRLIQEQNARIVLIGGKVEAQACDALVRRLDSRNVLNTSAQTSLKELAALLHLSDCLVTSDSGPMHVSVAVGTPVIALFGPTDPANYGPRSPLHTVIYQDLACSPCMNKELINPSCMSGIRVDAVYREVCKRLQRHLIPASVFDTASS